MPPCRCAASPLRGDHRCDFSLTRQLCRSFREWSFAAASSLQLEGAVTGLEPLSRGGVTSVGGWVGSNIPQGRAAKFSAPKPPCCAEMERAVCGTEPPTVGARPQAAGAPLWADGLRSRALPAADAARRSRGKHSDRVLRTNQGAVFGAALRFLQAPAAVRSKNRLSARGMRSVFCKGAPAARSKNRAPQPGGIR